MNIWEEAHPCFFDPPPSLCRSLALEGYTERRKTQRETRMVDIPAVIAEGEGGWSQMTTANQMCADSKVSMTL